MIPTDMVHQEEEDWGVYGAGGVDTMEPEMSTATH